MNLLIESAWENLLALKVSVTKTNVFSELTFIIKENHVEVKRGIADLEDDMYEEAIFLSDRSEVLKEHKRVFFWKNQKLRCHFQQESSFILNFLRLYLPYCYLSLASNELHRAMTVSHFAQTLDGKIATESGSSKWIGNEENLIHAHRMRSLVDAVLVGSRTYLRDNPKLTVRHVKGPDPAKLVIMPNQTVPRDNSFLVITSKDSPETDHPNLIRIESSDGIISCHALLAELYQRGIKTVYIEGGAFTTSCFLKNKLIDHLQIHFSNKILGSGKNSFLLSPVEEINDSLMLADHQYFQVGNEMMITGNVS